MRSILRKLGLLRTTKRHQENPMQRRQTQQRLSRLGVQLEALEAEVRSHSAGPQHGG